MVLRSGFVLPPLLLANRTLETVPRVITYGVPIPPIVSLLLPPMVPLPSGVLVVIRLGITIPYALLITTPQTETLPTLGVVLTPTDRVPPPLL